MENDLESSDRDTANVMANGHNIEASHAAAAAAIASSVHSGSITALPTSSTNVSPAKALSNIQPKIADSACNKRQIVPKSDGLTTAVQQLTGQPSTNLLVPQGIQHVLINGQLYPIIQTANGTHLLIQQPVGQVQAAGKQLFTAQPIQLGALQPLAGNTSAANQPTMTLPQTSQQQNSIQPKAGVSQSAAVSDVQTAANDTSFNSVAPVLPQMTSQIVPTSSATNSSIPSTFQPQPYKAASNVGTKSAKTSVTVDTRTQQLLNRIQNQIDAFKSKPSLDASAKTTLLQLEEAQRKVLNNVRSQAQLAQGMAQQTSNGVSNTAPAQPTYAHPSPQFLQQQVLQSNVKEKSLIIKPVADGASAVNEENVAAIIEAFTNVKVGNQIYNIQLMEDQKKLFVEEMSKMDAEQQHVYLTQQQTQILQTVFKNQQEQQMKAQSAMQNQQYPTTSFSQQPAIQPPANPLAAQSKLRPNARSNSGRRSANRGRKGHSPASTPPRAPVPTITLPDPVTKPSVKKARNAPHLSTKRIGEKMLQQIMKDQEILLKPGNHKKPFANKNQVKERLLRFHLFYTAESHKAYRRLQEEQLYRTTAHETVLGKEKLMDQFRSQLWRESIDPTQAAESILIAELLLQDEKEALENDKLLEVEDIERFKELYRQPNREPTPPPPSPLPSPTLPSNHFTASQATQSVENDPQRRSTSPETLDNAQASQPFTNSLNQTRVDFTAPDADVLTRVKRETAREARERRAAKRRETDVGLSKEALAILSSRKGKRGRKPKVASLVHASQTDQSEGMSITSPPPNDEFAEEMENKVYQQHTEDEASGVPSPSTDIQEESALESLEQPDMSSDVSNQTSSETKYGKQSEVSSSSDSEDELIDIGSPLSPPAEQMSPIVSLPAHRTESPPLSGSSLLTASDANSPRKGFSIFSETVIEQSEQPYMPMHYTATNTPFHSVSTDASNPGVSHPGSQQHLYTQQYYDDSQARLAYSSVPAEESWGDNDNVQSHNRRADSDVVSSPASNSSSSSSSDEEVGGTAVTWEDNSFNVPSEVPSEGEETEHSTDDGEVEGSDENVADDSPILPLRINKRKLGEYGWPSSKRSDSESPPAKQVSIPPPIKLRIKRDSNDKWEAASSVSSYTSDVNESEEEGEFMEDSDTEQPSEGGVAVNWEDEEQAYTDAEESEGDEDDDTDEMVPFEQYTSHKDSGHSS